MAIESRRQVIERYSANGFRVSGAIFLGAVLVFPERTIEWPQPALSPESLSPVVAAGGIELLLLGTGSRMTPVAPALRASLREHGIVIEAMDTGAACRTYNLLAAEQRRVAAALLPPT
jgi:uncharacterized protein